MTAGYRRGTCVAWIALACAMTSGREVAGQATLERKSVAAVRVAPGEMRIDGRLDEAVWRVARPAAEFVQSTPAAGEPASQRGEARIAFDAQNIYVGWRLYDTAPDSIGTQLARRDVVEIFADVVYVAFDSFNDHRTAFAFGVSAAGQQVDNFLFNDTQDDLQWDAVWQSAVQRDAQGWTAELRIPLSQLRFTPPADGAAPTWGVQFAREIARNRETDFWNPTPPDQPGVVSRFGVLTGLEGLEAPSRLELIPYVRGQVETQPVTTANPFLKRTAPTAAGGLDLRYRLPAGLTATATLNPDFGQVEADPAVVNLTQFEVFFPERRPFFLEGADIFRFGSTVTQNSNNSTTFFYSRRIGRAPRGTLGGDVAYADVPPRTTIDGALKISGKTASGLSVGVLAAATDEVFARVEDTLGVRASRPVEPGSAYLVSRLRQDFRQGNTVLGGFVSNTQRSLDNAIYLPILPQQSLVGGIDLEHAWQQRSWTISGFLAGSRVRGDRAYLTSLQRSPVRQYQRPDQLHMRVDTTASSLGGYFGTLSVAKSAGRRVLASATYEETSPGFEVNDLGFQTRADFRTLSTALIWRSPEQTPWFRETFFGVFSTHSFNFGGSKIEERYSLAANVVLPSTWEIESQSSWSPSTFDDRLLRGGYLSRIPEQWESTVGVRSDSRLALVGGLEMTLRSNATGEYDRGAEASFDLRPSPAVRLRLTSAYRWQYDTDQFVTSRADALSPLSNGQRYVFGDIRQTELSTTIRADWTFSPYLSLQLVAQPFVAAGRFDTYKEFATPGTFTFRPYTPLVRDGQTVRVDPDGSGPALPFAFDEQDFTVRALRGNAVVRWEYRPGCTVFFVWQQQREGEDPVARLRLTDDARRIFKDPMRNVFLIKATYWFQP